MGMLEQVEIPCFRYETETSYDLPWTGRRRENGCQQRRKDLELPRLQLWDEWRPHRKNVKVVPKMPSNQGLWESVGTVLDKGPRALQTVCERPLARTSEAKQEETPGWLSSQPVFSARRPTPGHAHSSGSHGRLGLPTCERLYCIWFEIGPRWFYKWCIHEDIPVPHKTIDTGGMLQPCWHACSKCKLKKKVLLRASLKVRMSSAWSKLLILAIFYILPLYTLHRPLPGFIDHVWLIYGFLQVAFLGNSLILPWRSLKAIVKSPYMSCK